jgi:phage regulator Rha-like protein
VTTLREFKAKYLARLLNLKKQLLEKYPERADRVNYIVDLLASKLENLRTFTLADYLFTLHLATKELPELEQLIPAEEEVRELLERGE